MTGSREEARLGARCRFERRIGLAQLLRALCHLGFERLLSPAVGSHVAVTGHIAATGRWIADDPHNAPVMLFAFHPVLAACAHMLQPARDLELDFRVGCTALPQVEADQVGDRGANARQFIRQGEHLLVAAVPGDEVHVLVHQRHALVYVLDRELQQVSAEGKTPIGLVEHGDHLFERHGITLRPARQKHARGRSADNARNRALHHRQHLLVRRIAVAKARPHRLDRGTRALLADELGEKQADVGHALGGNEPRPRAWRRRADESGSLRGINQCLAAHCRAHPVRRDIDPEAEQYARNQRIGMDGENCRFARRCGHDQEDQPACKACNQAGNHASLVPVAARDPEHEARRELRHGGKCQRAESCKVCHRSESEIEEIGEE